jgi:hypothetical protein
VHDNSSTTAAAAEQKSRVSSSKFMLRPPLILHIMHQFDAMYAWLKIVNY